MKGTRCSKRCGSASCPVEKMGACPVEMMGAHESPCCVHLQDDLLHETLTVTEVLYYAAMLRLPRTMSAEAKSARVLTVIRALGIEACKDTIIGARTLS